MDKRYKKSHKMVFLLKEDNNPNQLQSGKMGNCISKRKGKTSPENTVFLW